eukprot:TRINITY_DN32947_c0_g1_i2.p1 TRINITY_DN32947_c0_g1~~TRINITY_DN32947_c0_g1_i2.p1  ORF type:complete len:287 (+),score=63.55 TRINITY_DN32947_c0_g1_i2:146-1006(+)
MLAAAELNLPIIDADGMGRAYPTFLQVLWYLNGARDGLTNVGLANFRGEQSAYVHAVQPEESMMDVQLGLLKYTSEAGSMAAVALPGLNAQVVREGGPVHTLSQSWAIGRAVALAQARKDDPIEAVMGATAGHMLACGKIVRVERATGQGYDKGRVHIVALDPVATVQSLRVEFQNEMLVAFDTTGLGDENGVASQGGTSIAAVPDLICLLDSATGVAFQTEEIVYGLRVTVVMIPAHPMLLEEHVLPCTGPGFVLWGYSDDVVSYRAQLDATAGKPVSVFDLYRR